MGLAYWINAAGRIIKNLAVDSFRRNGHRLEFTRQWLAAGYAYDMRARLPSVHFLDLFPAAEKLNVSLGDVNFTRSNATPLEMYCLSCVAMLRSPARIFEFGTFDGATTLQLARACRRCEILTLDLDPGSARDDQPAVIETEVTNIRSGGVGHRFAGSPESSRIRQLLGDSTKFDYSPFAESIDLIFIDACHDYDFVVADTRSALSMIRPGGVIFWHDYVPGWPGVVRAIDELLPRYPVRHIAGTALAVLDTSRG